MIKSFIDLVDIKNDSKDKIPKNIFRTSKFKLSELPKEILDIYLDDIKNNPEYTVYYFDDKDCQLFMESLGDDRLLNAYNKLIPTAYKADLWRICILRKYGGIYMDYAHRALVSYDEIIGDSTEIYSKDCTIDGWQYGIYNAFICSTSDTKILNKIVELILQNVENNSYGRNCLDITSCQVLANAYNSLRNYENYKFIEVGDIVKLRHDFIDKNEPEKLYTYNYNLKLDEYLSNEKGDFVVKCRDIPNYYDITYSSNYQKDRPSTHYSSLYDNKMVFKDDRWMAIENLYKKVLNKTYDLEEIYNYYTSEYGIIEIEIIISQSKDLKTSNIQDKTEKMENNSEIKTYKDLKNYTFKEDGKIPKIIFRTSNKKLNELPENIIELYKNELLLNNGYTMFYFDDEDCQQSIMDSNDNNLIYAYNNLIPTAFKADLWRYYILHKYGGIYVDFSHKVLRRYDEIINNKSEVFVKDRYDHGIYNAFICTFKNNMVFKKAIYIIYNNVKYKKITDTALQITGPSVLGDAYMKINQREFNYEYFHKVDDNEYNFNNPLSYIVDINNELVVNCKQLNHNQIIYNNIENTKYNKLFERKIIYKDSRWMGIEYLYKILLSRKPDLDGLITYYTSNLYLDEIKRNMMDSEEYNRIPKKTEKDSLYDYEKRVFSQNNEDGIIEYLLNAIGYKNKYYVEFGVEDGSECNTRYIREQFGFTGLMMDGSNENHEIGLHKEFITPSNINTLFEKYNVPKEFDLLSIDIDFNDFYIWKNISDEYKPNIVIIEYNAEYAPPKSLVVKKDESRMWDFTKYYGGTLSAMNYIAIEKGYTLVYCDSVGVNSFFVRNELLNKLNVKIPDIYDIYVPYDRHRESTEEMIEYTPLF